MILLLTVRDTKNKFCISEIPVENSLLSSLYWMPKMHKKLIKPKFLIVPLRFSKIFSKNLKQIFQLFLRQTQVYHDECRFFTGFNAFWFV